MKHRDDKVMSCVACSTVGTSARNAYVIRTTGDDHEPARFHMWSPKVIGLIGKLPPTPASRAIHIELRRKTATGLSLQRVIDRFADLLLFFHE